MEETINECKEIISMENTEVVEDIKTDNKAMENVDVSENISSNKKNDISVFGRKIKQKKTKSCPIISYNKHSRIVAYDFNGKQMQSKLTENFHIQNDFIEVDANSGKII